MRERVTSSNEMKWSLKGNSAHYLSQRLFHFKGNKILFLSPQLRIHGANNYLPLTCCMFEEAWAFESIPSSLGLVKGTS